MANEINMNFAATATAGAASSTLSKSAVASLAGNAIYLGTQNIGTSEEAIVLGDVATIKFIAIVNNDATNFVEVDQASAISAPAAMKIPAGQFAIIPTEEATWYAKANTAAVDIQVWAVE